MKTTAEIQDFIFNKTGLKTGVKKCSGSMKGYYMIYPIFQNGTYPSIPFEIAQELKTLLPSAAGKPTFCSITSIDIHEATGIQNERLTFKKERKPKPIDGNKVSKGWGSKNSQLRLDKATRRYAKHLRNGNCARYY